jgi:hypothetical protein
MRCGDLRGIETVFSVLYKWCLASTPPTCPEGQAPASQLSNSFLAFRILLSRYLYLLPIALYSIDHCSL